MPDRPREICQICGKELKRVASHPSAHGMTLKEYRSIYPEPVEVRRYRESSRKKKWRTWAENNRERIRVSQQKYLSSLEQNMVRQKGRERAKLAYARNPEKFRKRAKEYRVEHRDDPAWRAKNNDSIKKSKDKMRQDGRLQAASKKYREENKDKINSKQRSPCYREQTRRREKARYDTDPNYNIEKRLRASLTQALRLGNACKKASVLELLGCTIDELKAHLEAQFLPGMSWENRSAWHIDHIQPCASFDLTDPENQRICFYYSNLRPLWGSWNQSKGKRLDWQMPELASI